jgi:hypothetical protein
MIVHDVEPLLVIVAALIKLCQFFFHATPKVLSRWKRRLMRRARGSRNGPARRVLPKLRPVRPHAGPQSLQQETGVSS